jgi:hypothetical protein
MVRKVLGSRQLPNGSRIYQNGKSATPGWQAVCPRINGGMPKAFARAKSMYGEGDDADAHCIEFLYDQIRKFYDT